MREQAVMFDAICVYQVNDGEIDTRVGVVRPEQNERLLFPEMARRPLRVSGIQRSDFAVSAGITDWNGSTEISYFVTEYSNDTSEIIPIHLIETNPQSHATLELARKLQSVNPDEMAQLGIDALMHELNRRFPFGLRK